MFVFMVGSASSEAQQLSFDSRPSFVGNLSCRTPGHTRSNLPERPFTKRHRFCVFSNQIGQRVFERLGCIPKAAFHAFLSRHKAKLDCNWICDDYK
jgi:ribulose-5-phosphate 4-epimerase/fuculose-1-phosphate aldolase